MEKIEPAAWVLDYQTMGGDIAQKLSWNRSGFGVCNRLCGEDHETPLYTREAFEAAMEAMKRECMLMAKEWAMSHVEVDHAPHGVDDEISKYVSVHEVLENILGE